jgi:hypothetical protein
MARYSKILNNWNKKRLFFAQRSVTLDRQVVLYYCSTACSDLGGTATSSGALIESLVT